MSTSTVDQHDIVELGDLLACVHDDEGTDEDVPLPWSFLHGLRDLVGCDYLSFLKQDPRRRLDHFCMGVSDLGDGYHEGSSDHDSDYEPFWDHYWSCESSAHPDTTADYTSITKISDFYSARQWHSTGMYVDYARPQEIEHELTMCLPDARGQSVRLLCYRSSGPDFGERERFLLALLRPHVGEAYRATARTRTAPPALTRRQVEILELVRDGCTNQQIGRRMGVSEGTVRTHLNNIYARLGVTSRTAAVVRGLGLAG